jgi:hypothetical protein
MTHEEYAALPAEQEPSYAESFKEAIDNAALSGFEVIRSSETRLLLDLDNEHSLHRICAVLRVMPAFGVLVQEIFPSHTGSSASAPPRNCRRGLCNCGALAEKETNGNQRR